MPTSSVGITSRDNRSLTTCEKTRDGQLCPPLRYRYYQQRYSRDRAVRPWFFQRGVTLLEMLIVMSLIALVAGLSYPSVASGVDSLRLRSASDGIVGFLNTAIDRAERRQQVIQVWISPRDNAMTARSPDLEFSRRFDLPDTVHILSVLPLAGASPEEPRGFLFYPGGTVPPIGVEIVNQAGRRRLVRIDPITGVPRSELEAP